MTEKESNNLKDIVRSFIETTKKHNEILEMQTESLLNNTINKDCKSKIYENIKSLEEQIIILKTNLNLCDKKINKIEEYLKGDGVYSKGLIAEIKDINESIQDIKDFIKEKSTTKKNFIALYNIMSGAGGAVIMVIIQLLIKGKL